MAADSLALIGQVGAVGMGLRLGSPVVDVMGGIDSTLVEIVGGLASKVFCSCWSWILGLWENTDFCYQSLGST